MQWIEDFLETNLAKLILIPLLTALLVFFGDWVKHRWFGGKDAAKMDSLLKAAELKDAVNKQNTSVDELKEFQKNALNDQIKVVAHQAGYWANLVGELNRQSMRAESDAWPEAITQADMNVQSSERVLEARREMIQTVLDVVAAGSKEQAATIQKSQDAWNAFVDLELKREAVAWEGGSIQPLMINVKHESLIRERAAALKAELTTMDGKILVPTRSKTPGNLLDHVFPSVPRERTEAWLGGPHYIYGDRWIYRYTDTQVEIRFNANNAIATVVVALVGGEIYEGAVGMFGPFALGKLTLLDLNEMYGELPLQCFESLRTKDLSVQLRLGPAGAWEYFYFGALIAFSGHLADSFFRFDECEERLLSDPKDTVFNWIGLSETTLEAPTFDWQLKG